MKVIKLIIAYDGTGFNGWQKQAKPSNGRTIQAAIEDALAKMHGHEVSLTGSGRTDAGVHAAGQVANFTTSINNIEPCRFVPALNGLLSQDVRILKADEVNQDFHSRFDARMRTYRYYFICGRHALPHESRYALQLWTHPQINLLNTYCRLLLGERDCSVFASAGDSSLSKIRHISRAGFFQENGKLIFEISANAYLRKMIRSVAGTFIHHAGLESPPELIGKIINSGDRSLAGPTLPPQGLFLWKVDF